MQNARYLRGFFAIAVLSTVCAAENTQSPDDDLPYGAAACAALSSSYSRCPRNLRYEFSTDSYNNKTFRDKVIKGTPAPSGAFPWIVAIKRQKFGGGWDLLCGGSLLDGEWILTAAHCEVTTNDQVIVGRRDLLSSEGVVKEIADVIVPTGAEIRGVKYDPETANYDIALLHLKEAAPGPFAILSGDRSLESNSDVHMFLAGWGTTSYLGNPSDILLQAEVVTLGDPTCQSDYKPVRALSSSSFCAIGVDRLNGPPTGSGPGSTVPDACNGDSGGPLAYIRPSDQVKVLTGVVSWGVGCGNKAYPTVYTRTSSIVNWLCIYVVNIQACQKPQNRT
jgi:secreted trypsin-like serine protease